MWDSVALAAIAASLLLALGFIELCDRLLDPRRME
jgi:hypothetical protein